MKGQLLIAGPVGRRRGQPEPEGQVRRRGVRRDGRGLARAGDAGRRGAVQGQQQATLTPYQRFKILSAAARIVESRIEPLIELMRHEAGFTRADGDNEVQALRADAGAVGRGGQAPERRDGAAAGRRRREEPHRLHDALAARRGVRDHAVQLAAERAVAQGRPGAGRRQRRRHQAVGVHAADGRGAVQGPDRGRACRPACWRWCTARAAWSGRSCWPTSASPSMPSPAARGSAARSSARPACAAPSSNSAASPAPSCATTPTSTWPFRRSSTRVFARPGQVCTSVQRLYVDRRIAATFVPQAGGGGAEDEGRRPGRPGHRDRPDDQRAACAAGQVLGRRGGGARRADPDRRRVRGRGDGADGADAGGRRHEGDVRGDLRAGAVDRRIRRHRRGRGAGQRHARSACRSGLFTSNLHTAFHAARAPCASAACM